MKVKKFSKIITLSAIGVCALGLASCSSEDVSSIAQLFNDDTTLTDETIDAVTPSEESTSTTISGSDTLDENGVDEEVVDSTSGSDTLDDMDVDDDYFLNDEGFNQDFEWWFEGHHGEGHHGHGHHGEEYHGGWEFDDEFDFDFDFDDDEFDDEDYDDEDVIYVTYEQYIQLQFIYDSYKAGKLTIDAEYFEETYGFSFETFLSIFGEDEETDEEVNDTVQTPTVDNDTPQPTEA